MLIDAWDEEEVRGETRVVLHLHPDVAPWQLAVLPLSKKPQLTDLAHALATRLRSRFRTEYDETQSIGRRYRRQDEIGTPLAITVDFDSLDDNAVTIRERDDILVSPNEDTLSVAGRNRGRENFDQYLVLAEKFSSQVRDRLAKLSVRSSTSL